MRLLVPAPTCLAKCSRANENTRALTVGKINQWTSPVLGRKGVEVGLLITLVDQNLRPFSDRTPHFADDRLEAQTVLDFTPQLYLRRRVFLLESQYPHR